MNKSIEQITAKVARAMRENGPGILTGVGVSGMIFSIVLAVKATPKALKRIEREKELQNTDELTVKDTVKAAWKCYIPTASVCTASAMCIIGASVINGKRNAALATVAQLTESAFSEYKAKVRETLGERKEKAIQDDIDRDRIRDNPPDERDILVTDGHAGQTLCYDSLLGRYFYSDIEDLRRAANNLNRQMATMSEPYISLNEFYSEIGLPNVDIGEVLGWNVNEGMIELRFSSHLANDKTPCLVMSHLVPPRHDYDKY